jgi:glycosyltransferase involved in cell wall biosynthesis
MHVFLNGLAASAGGGLTYLRNVIPELSNRLDIKATIVLSSDLRRKFEPSSNISYITLNSTMGAAGRFWREQFLLGRLIEESGADVLISAGNFALRHSPVPQILLSGNSLYTSRDFVSDLRSRREYLLLLDTFGKQIFAKRSILWADCTVAPSTAFAKELKRWTGINVKTIHHGFDHERFHHSAESLSSDLRLRLDAPHDTLLLLFVSHYNYYRNFETLLRAIPIIQQRLGTRPVKLLLTCKFESEKNPGAYKSNAAAALVDKLNIADHVLQLGAVPYEALAGLYALSHIYVTPAYTETFAHPLVEAMASGLPVVASDIPVHREVCGGAAVYFERFSHEELAKQVVQLAGSNDLRQSLIGLGLPRSRDFSWHNHVDQILALARDLQMRAPARRNAITRRIG